MVKHLFSYYQELQNIEGRSLGLEINITLLITTSFLLPIHTAYMLYRKQYVLLEAHYSFPSITHSVRQVYTFFIIVLYERIRVAFYYKLSDLIFCMSDFLFLWLVCPFVSFSIFDNCLALLICLCFLIALLFIAHFFSSKIAF